MKLKNSPTQIMYQTKDDGYTLTCGARLGSFLAGNLNPQIAGRGRRGRGWGGRGQGGGASSRWEGPGRGSVGRFRCSERRFEALSSNGRFLGRWFSIFVSWFLHLHRERERDDQLKYCIMILRIHFEKVLIYISDI